MTQPAIDVCGAICPDDLSLVCSLDKDHDKDFTDYHCSSDEKHGLPWSPRIPQRIKG